jgi:hypothetical protein
MKFNEDGEIEGYVPLFELGVINQNPAVKVLGTHTICSVTLAALITGLFEAVMRNVPENKQNEYEQQFKKSFRVLMKERHHYDVRFTEIHPDEDNEQ